MTDPRIRVGDAERDRVAEQLREHFAAGRLSDAELEERLDATYTAKTFGDLSPVLADLPALPTPRSTQPAAAPAPGAPAQPAPPSWLSKGLRAAWAAWFVAVSVNVVIWVLVSISAGELIYFWPMWVAGPWGAVLVASTLAGRSAPDHFHGRRDRDSRRDQRRIDRRDRRGRGELR